MILTRHAAFLLLALALPASAFAQYDGPALEACRMLAEREADRNAATDVKVVIERGDDLLLERFERKLGSQTIAAILSGRGAIVYQHGASAELAFYCLLADEKRPLMFYWLPHQNVSALAQCTRSEALQPKAEACLAHLLVVAEVDLLEPASSGFQASRERDVAAGNENSSDIFRSASQAWRAYRDAECARRQDAAGGDALVRLACMVELTRQRRHDLRAKQ